MQNPPGAKFCGGCGHSFIAVKDNDPRKSSDIPSFEGTPAQLSSRKQDIQHRITVREKLHYRIDIGKKPFLETRDTTGAIEIALSQIDNDYLPIKQSRAIGYLGLSNYKGTDWSEKLENADNSLTAVKIPVYIRGMKQDERLIHRFDYTLKLNESVFPARPVFLEVDILDDEDFIDDIFSVSGSFHNKLRLRLKISSEFSRFSEYDRVRVLDALEQDYQLLQKQSKEEQTQINRLKKREITDLLAKKKNTDTDALNHAKVRLEKIEDKQKIYRKWLEIFDKKHTQTDDWIIPYEEFVSEKLSGDSEKLSDSINDIIHPVFHKVKLEYIEVKSPHTRPSIRTILSVGKNKYKHLNWTYNPQRQSLKLDNQFLTWNPDTTSYEASLYFDLDPSKDESAALLKGSLVLGIDETISGLNVEWLDEKDKKNKSRQDNIDSKTWISLAFSIELAEIFKSRLFTPQRKLYFEGVVPQLHHFNSIIDILNNHELTILPDQTTNLQEDKRQDEKYQGEIHFRGNIVALRQGAFEDIIGIGITGIKKEGEHTIYYNEKQEQLKQSIDTGNLNITLATKMRKPSNEINRLLNSIQLAMEDYFVSASTSTHTKQEVN